MLPSGETTVVGKARGTDISGKRSTCSCCKGAFTKSKSGMSSLKNTTAKIKNYSLTQRTLLALVREILTGFDETFLGLLVI